MSNYQRILVALDLSPESQVIVDRVKALFSNDASKITLIHVLEPLSFIYGGDIPIDLSELQEQMEKQATDRLREAGNKLNVPVEGQHVIIGQPAHEIQCFAKKVAADLIVVGTHGRHGLARIFGSTANGVLHGAPCDVFAVLIKGNNEQQP